jgi:hypothetical protein
MEQAKQSNYMAAPLCCVHAAHSLENNTDQRDSSVDSVLTDAVFRELKRHSAHGCLLCSLDALPEEEWD